MLDPLDALTALNAAVRMRRGNYPGRADYLPLNMLCGVTGDLLTLWGLDPKTIDIRLLDPLTDTAKRLGVEV